MNLEKSYEPQKFEAGRYQTWMESGAFEASDFSVPGQNAYCIMIPPPNVTGVLHMGHALGNTLQDALIRWRRMKGDNTLWLPGTDHAGIATQTQVEKAIAKEGRGPLGRPLTRHDLGREKFLERTWAWKEKHADQIKNQLKVLGSSYDWSRERFTLDEGLSQAVREVFVSLYEEGLIYRGERIINWCTRCRTALSDLEVVPTDRKGKLYHIQYEIRWIDQETKKQKKSHVTIATTRPETLLGDSAIAIHPEDERYTSLHGKSAVLPLLGRKLKIITDEYVDRAFGTGVLKVTPAHDFNDYDLGMKHQLSQIQVMGKDGRITEEGGKYAGLKFSEAREAIIQDLESSGVLLKVEDHPMKVGICQRCDTVVEPIISKQWFVKTEPLAKPAIEAVETGKIQFAPESWKKTYFEWMYNIRDWCISRQLWWGHQIPAWYCGECDHITVSRDEVKVCEKCKSTQVTRDEDVLDTWFSSALWPFSTLGWPQKTQALQTFYPTSVLETGFDIIFFWVARMIMMGIHFMKEIPFSKVYLHAMVRDEKGQKMSKTRGNVIDPLEVISQHGADPLRFTLASMAGQGRDIKLSIDRVEGYRAFANKLWNATKFFHLQLEETQGGMIEEPEEGFSVWVEKNACQFSTINQWILSLLQKTIEKTEKGLSTYQINDSCQALYEFAWLEFCDWFIEFSKWSLKVGPERTETLLVLRYVFEQLFRLLHPIMPFVTEELWLSLPWIKPANSPTRKRDGKPELLTLMLQDFPRVQRKLIFPESEANVLKLKAVIEAIRNFRGENQISPKKEFLVRFTLRDQNQGMESFIHRFKNDLLRLSKISDFVQVSSETPLSQLESVIPLSALPMDLRISLEGLVDVEAEKMRLNKSIAKVKKDLEHCQDKLRKESFISKAPAELIEKEKETEKVLIQKKSELELALKKLK